MLIKEISTIINFIQNQMKTIKLTVVQTPLGGGCYESPRTTVTEVVNEGVLCMSTGNSGAATIEKWDEEVLNW